MREAHVVVIPDPSARPESTRRRRSPSMPLRRIVGAVMLSAAIFALALLTGPHIVAHLLGADGDSAHCVVCVAIHGARAGVPAAPLALVAALMVVGRPATDRPLAISAVSLLSSTPRAPPTIG